MERQLILDLFTGVLAVMVFAFLWVGLFVECKNVDWDNNHEGLAYIGFCIIVAVATVGCMVIAYFWFTEHMIYFP